MEDALTPEVLLQAYCSGVFPMAEPDGSLYWYRPDPRAIIPMDAFRISRRLRKEAGRFEVSTNTAFSAVMRGCADRDETWISDELIQLYGRLHDHGFAHSVECRVQGRLVGGLYGVSIGGAFFGESMYSRETGASKAALVHLADRLAAGGFRLLDIQFITDHMLRFGAIEIPRAEYEHLLLDAISDKADWTAIDHRIS